MSDKIVTNKISKFIGLKFPLTNSQHGYFNPSILTREQVSANIISILTTNRGERIMRPDMGISTYNILFEKYDKQSLENQIRIDIEEELEKWFQNIEIIKLNIVEATESELTISLAYNINNDIFEELEFSIIGG